MNPFSKAFCRIYQTCFHLALPLLPYREPKVYHDLDDVKTILKEEIHAKSVLLVTDKGLSQTECFRLLKEDVELSGVNVVVYDETSANPTVKNVNAAKKVYLDNKCDALIAYGGGSPMDCAKGVGALIAYPKKTINQMRGLLKVLRKIPPLIAIPTTAGTGSEVTITSVITDSDTKYKYTINSFTLIPYYAILDPKVTVSLPGKLTSTTGMDALTHATEAFIGRSTSKETERLSLEAVKLIFDNILVAYEHPDNIEARKNMLLAAYKAGIAFSKSYVGYIHAIAHSLGGQYNTPHGLANAVIMPYLLKAYGKSAEKRLYRLGQAAGVVTKEDSIPEGAKKYIAAIEELNRKMGIPTTFPQIQEKDIPTMSKHAAKEANPLYPVPKLMNAKELESFYHILKGEQHD